MLILGRKREQAFYCNEMLVVVESFGEDCVSLAAHLSGQTMKMILRDGDSKKVKFFYSDLIIKFCGFHGGRTQGRIGISASRDVLIVREELETKKLA